MGERTADYRFSDRKKFLLSDSLSPPLRQQLDWIARVEGGAAGFCHVILNEFSREGFCRPRQEELRCSTASRVCLNSGQDSQARNSPLFQNVQNRECPKWRGTFDEIFGMKKYYYANILSVIQSVVFH